MKGLAKNLGLILILIGAVILLVIFLTGSSAVNNNTVLFCSGALMIIGLVTYIVINRHIAD